MKLRSREPYWLLKDGLVTSYPSLKENTTCDILIIGAGITGALMAYQFSKEGYNTSIIDKRDVGLGSTAATTAMLQYEIDEPLSTLSKKIGIETALDSYRAGIRAIDDLEKITKDINSKCEFEEKRSLYFAAKSSHKKSLRIEFEQRLNNDFPVEWIAAEELKAMYGIIGDAAILSYVGATIDAYRLTHDLLAHSKKVYGLNIFDHTEAKKIDRVRNEYIIHSEGRNSIRCKHIIFATGYESETMLNEKVVDLNSTYAFVSEPLDEIPDAFKSTIFWNTDDPYLYLRGTPDGRILVGGGDEKFQDAARRDKQIEKKEKYLLKRVKKAFPGLSLTPDFSWAGTFGVTKDALPYIGEHKKYPGSYFVLGFGGNGITFSIMGMKIISDLISGRSNKFEKYYGFNR